MRKQKKIIISVIVVLVVVLVAVFAVRKGGTSLFSKKETGKTTENSSDKGNTSADSNQSNSAAGDSNSTAGNGTSSSGSNNSSSSKSNKTFGEKGNLPYVIPDTNLQIQKIAGYKGIFIEDGSDKKISNVTAIALKNTGKEKVEYADITIKRGNKKLEFKASAIKPGATIVVQEANKTAYKEGTYSDCQAQVAYTEKFDMSKDQIKIKDNGDNSLTVKNISKKKIPCVRIFYKYYMEDEKAYVGGITYTAKIEDLEAGKSIKITPSHYVSDSSKIMMVRTYTEKN